MPRVVPKKAAEALSAKTSESLERSQRRWGGEKHEEVRDLAGEERTKVHGYITEEVVRIEKKEKQGKPLDEWDLRVKTAYEAIQQGRELSPEERAAVYFSARRSGKAGLETCNAIYRNLTGREKPQEVRKRALTWFKRKRRGTTEEGERKSRFVLEEQAMEMKRRIDTDPNWQNRSQQERWNEAWDQVFRSYCGQETDRIIQELEQGAHQIDREKLQSDIAVDREFLREKKTAYTEAGARINEINQDLQYEEQLLNQRRQERDQARADYEQLQAQAQPDKNLLRQKRQEFNNADKLYKEQRALVEKLRKEKRELGALQKDYEERRGRMKAAEKLLGGGLLERAHKRGRPATLQSLREMIDLSSGDLPDEVLYETLSNHTGRQIDTPHKAAHALRQMGFSESIEVALISLIQQASAT